jgi:hypothetical protein
MIKIKQIWLINLDIKMIIIINKKHVHMKMVINILGNGCKINLMINKNHMDMAYINSLKKKFNIEDISKMDKCME